MVIIGKVGRGRKRFSLSVRVLCCEERAVQGVLLKHFSLSGCGGFQQGWVEQAREAL